MAVSFEARHQPGYTGSVRMNEADLRNEIRAMLVETLMLSVPAGEIGDDRSLFGPEGVGLDSVDALQLVVALDKKYGVKITDQQVAQQVLRSVATMAQAVMAIPTNPEGTVS
jgi:acyl carrier protein